jgi:hypothetical protein
MSAGCVVWATTLRSVTLTKVPVSADRPRHRSQEIVVMFRRGGAELCSVRLTSLCRGQLVGCSYGARARHRTVTRAGPACVPITYRHSEDGLATPLRGSSTAMAYTGPRITYPFITDVAFGAFPGSNAPSPYDVTMAHGLICRIAERTGRRKKIGAGGGSVEQCARHVRIGAPTPASQSTSDRG